MGNRRCLMIHFKKGLYTLHSDKNYNFQLNRVVNWDGGRLEDVTAVSQSITNPKEWKKTLIKLGDIALEEKRIENAIAYYRMSEFFMYNGDSDKLKYYRLSKELFYKHTKEYFEKGIVGKQEVPYETGNMPVLISKTTALKKGVIVLFGGNDSYMEELFYPMLYLQEQGYDVYIFEGPGQGAVLRELGITFTYQWEHPVKAILDYFHLDEVILIGISLGGFFAPRAAAFEKRVSKVVAWSVFPSFIDVITADFSMSVRFLYKTLLKCRCKMLLNLVIAYIMKKEPTVDWGVRQGMHAYGAASPYEYLKKITKYTITDTAEDDHFIQWDLYKKELDMLKNAKSITFRLFTEKEEASDHCQVGNTALALKTIIKWLETVE